MGGWDPVQVLWSLESYRNPQSCLWCLWGSNWDTRAFASPVTMNTSSTSFQAGTVGPHVHTLLIVLSHLLLPSSRTLDFLHTCHSTQVPSRDMVSFSLVLLSAGQVPPLPPQGSRTLAHSRHSGMWGSAVTVCGEAEVSLSLTLAKTVQCKWRGLCLVCACSSQWMVSF